RPDYHHHPDGGWPHLPRRSERRDPFSEWLDGPAAEYCRHRRLGSDHRSGAGLPQVLPRGGSVLATCCLTSSYFVAASFFTSIRFSQSWSACGSWPVVSICR